MIESADYTARELCPIRYEDLLPFGQGPLLSLPSGVLVMVKDVLIP